MNSAGSRGWSARGRSFLEARLLWIDDPRIGVSEGRDSLNASSHCDIAWAGALATRVHLETPCCIGCLVA